MDRKDLVKKILELSLELKDAEGVQAMMCITAVKDYEKQLRLYSVSQQRGLLVAFLEMNNWLSLEDEENAKGVVDCYLKAINCG